MPKLYSQEEKERYRALLNVQLKKEERSLPDEERIRILKKKNRNKWWMLGLNIVAILFFGYSFLYGITQLSNTLMYILLVVFVVNVGLILYQKKQLADLAEYLQWKQQHER